MAWLGDSGLWAVCKVDTGRVWTLVAGGGASVVYADAIASAGFASELANYGEYSGAPTETQTFHYARTVIDLMLRAPIHPDGKVLFIGGGIANFTNVSSLLSLTFKLKETSANSSSTGRKHVQRRHPRHPRSRTPPQRAQGPNLGPSRRTQLPGRSEEHQGRGRGTASEYARLWPGYARFGYRASGVDTREGQGRGGIE